MPSSDRHLSVRRVSNRHISAREFIPRGNGRLDCRLLGAGALLAICAAIGAFAADPPPLRSLTIDPPQIELSGRDANVQLLVTGETEGGQLVDLTHDAEYRVERDSVVEAARGGRLFAVGDGTAQVRISAGGKSAAATVVVVDSASSRTPHFERDVVPILSRFGCNSSGCHGKAEGQNGFKLSVFGFDPPADYRAIVMQGRGRRVFPASPQRSLLLRKASGGVPHGGGVRLDPGRAEYRTLLRWIEAGMPVGAADAPRVQRVIVSPAERVARMGGSQQLRVTAVYGDGREEDVTALATYQSNDAALAAVDEAGRVRFGEAPGVVAVMASYMGAVNVFRAIVPRQAPLEEGAGWAENNFIDVHVNRRLRQLGIRPAPPADEAAFLRRVYLDTIGTLPTADEARAYLANDDPNKRKAVVEALLVRPEFADYWALKWADVLQVNRLALGHKQAHSYYRWIRANVAANVPLDEFAASIVTAEGPLRDNPAGNFYKVVKQPGEMADVLSQVFLGVRIECAKCHHHPFDRWSQDDYYGMQASFAQVAFKSTPRGEGLIASAQRKTTHPRRGDEIFARPLGEPKPEAQPAGDRRRQLARWMTSRENPWFARNLANRVWAHMMGRGLIEPVDDARMTNPPSNPALLDALAAHLAASDFNVRSLFRAIAASAAYRRSTEVNGTNARDEQNYSRYPLKPLPAEVLLDAVCQATGVAEKFDGAAAGTRAIQLWDSEVRHYFLRLFGRPTRTGSCECERASEPTVGQVLHLLNAPQIQAKLAHARGNVRRWCAAFDRDDELAEEMYLTLYARRPTGEEKQNFTEYLAAAPDRRQGVEDLAWSMLNSLEFVFNH